ncbi:MAG: hypothetical protein A2Y12_08365 [Planctomycetes bacterium GWF2_42_9]|nr:MAG: hypothetical protein A2Y12_08365 [Planctomycetes bacterium GWF2_42_9]
MNRKESKVSRQSLETAAKNGYFGRTGRSIYALIFLLPFIILYEILVLKINPQILVDPASHIRGGVVAFVWIQNFLHYIGMNGKVSWICAPLVIIVTLIVLQITSRLPWKIVWSDFLVMTGECITISLPLIVLAMVLNRPSQQGQRLAAVLPEMASMMSGHNFSMDIITGIGAGIYEELIFRLVLICLLMLFFETILGVNKTNSILFSILISAVLFSLHHHFVFIHGRFARSELFALAPFIFRTIAGMYFAVIFVVRGFGIVAGAHIFYDIIATILNILLFKQY